MKSSDYSWEIMKKLENQKSKVSTLDIIEVLLRNRGIKSKREKEEFFEPLPPFQISTESLGIDKKQVDKVITRIDKARKIGEEIIIYGDYDADGICATAILWEGLYSLTKKVRPYIPNRFDEGYGLNAESVQKLVSENEKLKIIITVDNGIVANKAVNVADKLGVDVIITDHHQKGKKSPNAYSIIHTDRVSGSAIAWILAREILKKLQTSDYRLQAEKTLELAAIGTIADQLPLLGPSRSFAKYGLAALNKTQRPGLLALFENAVLKKDKIGTYEINFVIAPRLNAMGRMEHAIDSLRLLCTKNYRKAMELAKYLGVINAKRQKLVGEVVLHAREMVNKSQSRGVIVLAHESYHEGVIGLVASALVEEFYKPTIVVSKGIKISKASARSTRGFNIIENIRKLDSLILGGGGHPMAAGFSIETSKIGEFAKKLNEISLPILTKEFVSKSLKVDMEIDFGNLNLELAQELTKFEPTGLGNPGAVFVSKNVKVLEARTVGADGKHLKLKLEKDNVIISSIAFKKGELFPKIPHFGKIDIVFNVITDHWNGNESLQLMIKDLKIKDAK